jgi:hypothetical protein
MIHVVFRFERDSMELWVESQEDVVAIEQEVFNQTPQLVVLHGFEKSWSLEGKEAGVAYYPKQVNFPSVEAWGMEVIDYTEKVDNG